MTSDRPWRRPPGRRKQGRGCQPAPGDGSAAFFKIAASSLIGLGVVGLLIRLAPHPGMLGLYLLLAFGLSLYMVLHAHRMIGFLEVTGREDPSWDQIRKKAVLSRVLCAISAGLLLLALLMVVTVIVLQVFQRTVAAPN